MRTGKKTEGQRNLSRETKKGSWSVPREQLGENMRMLGILDILDIKGSHPGQHMTLSYVSNILYFCLISQA